MDVQHTFNQTDFDADWRFGLGNVQKIGKLRRWSKISSIGASFNELVAISRV